MKHLKLYEEHLPDIKNNEFHLNILKNGLRNGKYDVINLALDKGVVLDSKFIDSLYEYFVIKHDVFDMGSTEYQEMIDKMMNSIDPNIEESLDLCSIGLRSLKFVERLPNLKRLKCAHNYITSLDGVQHLKKLIYINANNNDITNITALNNNTSLRELSLSNNKITSLESLRNMRNLSKLFIARNQISDLEPLQKLSSIYHLSASYNNISDLEPVKEILSDMENIFLNGNPIPYSPATEKYRKLWAGSDSESAMNREYVKKKYNI